MYCENCQAMTGALYARVDSFDPIELRCSRCGRIFERDNDEDDDDDNDDQDEK